MAYGKVYSATLQGTAIHQIEVEVDGSRGKPQLRIVGLASKAVMEARDRITSALMNSGVRLKALRTVVNLAPASLHKSQSYLDLAIAVAILKMYGRLPHLPSDMALFGELSLTGRLQPLQHDVALLYAAEQAGFTRVLLPTTNCSRLHMFPRLQVFQLESLQQLVSSGGQVKRAQPVGDTADSLETAQNKLDFTQVRGLQFAKRALQIAIAGKHPLLLFGPPGVGKTLLVNSATCLVPPLSLEQQKLQAVLSPHQNEQTTLIAPHHTTTRTALIGGGLPLSPGALSKAHGGILFLDELLEFSKRVLDALRQPLESSVVTLRRGDQRALYPAEAVVIAATNLCPCGHTLSLTQVCTCSPLQKKRYQVKLSGPLLQRFALHVGINNTAGSAQPTSSNQQQQMRQAVVISRQRQQDRTKQLQGISFNSQLPFHYFDDQKNFNPQVFQRITSYGQQLQLSSRQQLQLLQVTLTIADLDAAGVQPDHFTEALDYRSSFK